MRIVVTGGCGFIGSNLVRRLAHESSPDEVVVIDDLSTGREENLEGLDVALHRGSILDRELLDVAFVGADAIVHLAARPSVPRSVADPVASHRANATGTVEVLEAARRAGSPHLIAASSSSVYGRNEASPKHENLAPSPMSPYAASKLATEGYVLSYAACFGLPVLVFRFFNVFGPGQPAGHAYAAAIPAFVDAALNDRPIPVYGDGEQTRDFTFVGSVVEVLADALERMTSWPAPVNLAFGEHRSLHDVIRRLGKIVGHELDVEYGPPRAGDVRHSQADQARLRELFPHVNEIDFEVGLERTVEWFRHQHRDG